MSRLTFFPKIAFAVLLMALQAAQVSSSHFLDNSIIGDFSTAGEMNPEVVINFLGSCAGKSINTSSCPVSTFIENVFGNDKWGSQCVPILSGTFDMVVPEYTYIVTAAFSTCGDDDLDARDDLIAALTDSTCFAKVCQDDAHLDIESTWMRSCAKVHLPYSKPKADGMFTIMPDDEDIVLSCMLHEAMSSPASDFDLSNPSDTSIEKCYPPGYPMTDSVCYSKLAPVLFARCSNAGYDPSDGMMSYYTGFQGNEADISNDFCTRMDKIAAPENLSCLVPLCDYTAPTPPSSSPTANPTSSPSSIPTVTPGNPSAAPVTAKPSASPSIAPSNTPSSSTASQAPSPAPSASQTITAQPTHSEAQATVQTEVYSEFTLLGITNQDVANADLGSFFEVLANAVISVVDKVVDGDINVEIVVLGGISTRRLRQLEETGSLDVEFKAMIVSECFHSNCADGLFSASVAEKFKSALVASIQDARGNRDSSLAQKINVEARPDKGGVAILTTVTVEDKPLAYFNFASKVVNADVSAARAVSGTTMVSLPAFTASLLVLSNLAL